MNAKQFCQAFGITQNDAQWIQHKYKADDCTPKGWFDKVGKLLTNIPTTLIEAIQPKVETTLVEAPQKVSKKAKQIDDIV